jgi:cytochrome c oxidase cbb3-type subunit 4
MDVNLVREAVTVLSFLAFIGIVAYAVWPGNRGRFDAAARVPLEEDDAPSPRPSPKGEGEKAGPSPRPSPKGEGEEAGPSPQPSPRGEGARAAGSAGPSPQPSPKGEGANVGRGFKLRRTV